jgi:energy-coupling factor transporter ATP-binding protein EcfA2
MPRKAPTPKPNATYYNSDEVRGLLRTLQEATRATPKGGPNVYIPPAGGDAAEANYNHFVFGQRGSGKSSLLRHLQRRIEEDGRIAVWTDQEIFSALAYPDVLVSAVLEVMEGAQRTLKNRFRLPLWRRLLVKLGLSNRGEVGDLLDLLGLVTENLRTLKFAPLDRKIEWIHSRGIETKREALGSIRVSRVEVRGSGNRAEKADVSTKEVVESTKEEYLERSLVDFRRLLIEASEYCGGGFVFLDDLYLLAKHDQPLVLGYMHRLLKDTGLWLKVGSIRYSTVTYRAGDPPIGMQLAHDAHEIALDRGIRLFQLTQEFLETILTHLAEIAGVDLERLLTDGARKRLMLASGGVVRDYLRLTAGAIEQARNRVPTTKTGTDKVTVEDVNKAAGSIAPSKLDDLKQDAPEEAAALQAVVVELTEFCRQSRRAYFLVDSSDRELSNIMDALHHHRYAHLLEESETVPDKGSQRFNVWLLDVAELNAQRATQQMDFDGWQDREKRRNRRLIFQRGWRDSLSVKSLNKKDVAQSPPAKRQLSVTRDGDPGGEEPTLFDP